MAIAYTELANIFNKAGGEEVGIDEHRDQALGIQAEIEERQDAWATSGVLSGGACSIDGTDVDVAAIDAYAQGKRYQGSDSVAFSGSDAANDYYIYLDPADDVTPLTKSAVEPTGDECVLCIVTWNGADTLSALVDLRQWGIEKAAYHVQVIGAVSADTVGIIILDRDFWIETVKGSLETCGTGAGPSYIDIHAGDGGSEATIWTTQSRRITIAHDATDGAVAEGGVPEANRKLTAGQKILVIVDAVATDPADLGVVVVGRYY